MLTLVFVNIIRIGCVPNCSCTLSMGDRRGKTKGREKERVREREREIPKMYDVSRAEYCKNECIRDIGSGLVWWNQFGIILERPTIKCTSVSRECDDAKAHSLLLYNLNYTHFGFIYIDSAIAIYTNSFVCVCVCCCFYHLTIILANGVGWTPVPDALRRAWWCA